MFFRDIEKQESIKKILLHAVGKNHIPHAQLFLGQPGSPNLALAMAFASYLVCENKLEDDACGTCAACSKSRKFIHPDIHFIFPVATTKKITKEPISSLFNTEWRTFLHENIYGGLKDWATSIEVENKTCQISKEESRTIIKDIYLKPFEASFNLFIVWLPESMHPSAANALLKVLEEPPQHTLFLLVSHDYENILSTILSRTQLITIPSYSTNEIKTILETKYQFASTKAASVAYLADGNLNEAIQLAQEVEADHHQLFRDWMRLCYSKDYTQLIEWADLFQGLARQDQKNLLLYGLHTFRECLLVITNCSPLLRTSEKEIEFIKKFSQVLTVQKIHNLSEKLNQAIYHLERNGNGKITFLDLSIELSQIIH